MRQIISSPTTTATTAGLNRLKMGRDGNRGGGGSGLDRMEACREILLRVKDKEGAEKVQRGFYESDEPNAEEENSGSGYKSYLTLEDLDVIRTIGKDRFRSSSMLYPLVVNL